MEWRKWRRPTHRHRPGSRPALSETPRPSVICGKMPDGTSSDRIPTKVTLAIRPKTNHENGWLSPFAGIADTSVSFGVSTEVLVSLQIAPPPLCNVRTGQPASRITRCVVEPNTSRFTTPFPCTPMTTRSTRSSATTFRISSVRPPLHDSFFRAGPDTRVVGHHRSEPCGSILLEMLVVLRHAQIRQGWPVRQRHREHLRSHAAE